MRFFDRFFGSFQLVILPKNGQKNIRQAIIMQFTIVSHFHEVVKHFFTIFPKKLFFSNKFII